MAQVNWEKKTPCLQIPSKKVVTWEGESSWYGCFACWHRYMINQVNAHGQKLGSCVALESVWLWSKNFPPHFCGIMTICSAVVWHRGGENQARPWPTFRNAENIVQFHQFHTSPYYGTASPPTKPMDKKACKLTYHRLEKQCGWVEKARHKGCS